MYVLQTIPKFDERVTPGTGIKVTAMVDGIPIGNDGFVLYNTGDVLTAVRYCSTNERGYKVVNIRAIDCMNGVCSIQLLEGVHNG